MAKRDVDQKVKQAIGALLADKETAVRGLAEVLDKIESADAQIAGLIAARNALVDDAEKAHTTAKAVGWKARELSDAGLSVPKPIDASLTVSGAPSASPAPATAGSAGGHDEGRAEDQGNGQGEHGEGSNDDR